MLMRPHDASEGINFDFSERNITSHDVIAVLYLDLTFRSKLTYCEININRLF